LTYVSKVLTFIETRLFTKLADDYLGADGLVALQLHLLQHPESGAIIQGSGGLGPGPENVAGCGLFTSCVLSKVRCGF
jgi:hypothetical protein